MNNFALNRQPNKEESNPASQFHEADMATRPSSHESNKVSLEAQCHEMMDWGQNYN